MKTINLIQMISEILVILGFLIGLIPFGYIISMYWVIPLTIINLIFAIISKNKTLIFTIVNVVMAVFSLIPLIGYLTRIIGIVISVISISKIDKR